MRRLMGWVSAAVLAAGMGCSSTDTSKTPCDQCTYAYVPVKKASVERHAVCIKDGKMYDCTKHPAECPVCAKAQLGE